MPPEAQAALASEVETRLFELVISGGGTGAAATA